MKNLIQVGRVEGRWLGGGVAGAVALLAIGWFLLIGPQNSETTSLNDQTSTEQDRADTIQRRVAELRDQERNLPIYQAQLATGRQALPATPGLPDFLRLLQSAGDASGVSVSGVSVGGGGSAEAPRTVLYSVPITLTVTGGNATKVNLFIDQLRLVQPRAVLIISVNVMPAGNSTTLSGATGLTLGIKVFVLPATTPAAAPSPSPTH